MIDFDPCNDGIYNNRGDAFVMKEELDRAILDYTEAYMLKHSDGVK
jgi:hypothetical protein